MRESLRRYRLAIFVAVAGIMAATALAVHDLDLLQLDRNAVDEGGGEGGSAPGDDWDVLHAGGGNAARFTGVLNDIAAPGTQFQGGGSKDNNDINQWLWKPGEPLDKDDITNAYAAAYVNTVDTGDNNVGDLILYHGLDRFANNGSAQVGFWFFQNPIGLTDIPLSGGFTFSGVHKVGDVLVQSNFSQGGVISTISVFAWVGTGGSHGPLDLRFSAADCVGLAADDPACATVNQVDTAAPWPYTPKSGAPGTFPQGSFYEGGINITRLVPEAGCFTSFLAETRTSTPFDARLKDFVLGSFELCEITVQKTGEELSKVGDDVDYTITVQNTGAITLFRQSIDDSLLGDLTDPANPAVTFSDCEDSLEPGASCTINATRTVLAGDPDPLVNTVTAVYDSRSDLLGDEATNSDDHSVNLFQPGIGADKTGDALAKVGDDVDYTITLSNNSSEDTPPLNCTATDSLLGKVFDGVLPPGQTVLNASRAVQQGDPDPLVNTVTLTCTMGGFTNLLEASDSHSTDLFQPRIAVDKTGDTLSKVGDAVDYTITLSNNSSADTPALTCTATDTLLGPVFSGVLPAGDTVVNLSRTVQSGDPDPLSNTVTLTCTAEGFPNVFTASDSHEVNLFRPAIAVDKTGDSLSKVGDTVDYAITLSNNSTADTPALDCTATDTLLGAVFSGVLPAGNTVVNLSRTVQQGDPDPLSNTVTLVCTVSGFGNRLEASDDHTVNLFQPAIAVDKTGDTLSKVGDAVDYTITLSNNSSADSPALDCTATDTLLGPVFSGLLPAGNTVVNLSRTVQQGDPDPLSNTVTLACTVSGFGNRLEASDDHTVNLFQPAVAVDKTGDTLSKVGDPVDYTITLSNNSSADTPALTCTATDTLLGPVFNGVLAAGNTVVNQSRTVQSGDPDPLSNTVTLTCTADGFPNVFTASDSHEVNLFRPAIAVDKTGDTLSKVGDAVDYTITLSNNSTGDAPALDCTATDTLLGAVFSGVLPVGNTVVNLSRAVQQGDPDPLSNTVTLVCTVSGFGNRLEASDDHTVDLFQPAIAVDKTGDALSKVGDAVDYTITLSNNSSADTPAMNCTAADTLLGTVFNAPLPLGNTVVNRSRTVQPGDPDPLSNTVTLTCTLAGFPNVLEASEGHSTNLFTPGVEVTKTGPATAARGETITYTFTVNNTSSADAPNLLLDSVTDTVLGNLTAAANAAGCGTLAPSASCTFTASYTIQASDPSPLVNVVTVHYHPAGFPNDIRDDDDHRVLIPIQGCTPGFWQGGAGSQLWNSGPPDPDWTGAGTNPYIHTTLFNTFFSAVTDSRLAGLTMFDIVASGGTSDSARRAARDMVAAYLNETAFPGDFPASSLADLTAAWYSAVAGGDAALDAFHVQVSQWNSPAPPGFCPLP